MSLARRLSKVFVVHDRSQPHPWFGRLLMRSQPPKVFFEQVTNANNPSKT